MDAATAGPAAQRFRRKSVLPVDEQVMTELQRHKSLEDLINKAVKPIKSESGD